jgi:hypothetical protein
MSNGRERSDELVELTVNVIGPLHQLLNSRTNHVMFSSFTEHPWDWKYWGMFMFGPGISVTGQ